jgi:phosphopantothenoylcysteine decarboxylase/phosphopantothenate--cysteine ligase
MLTKREIVLGVTGGIAAYKAAEVCRELIRRGAEVQVVMTPNATRFVTPLTFQALSSRPVVTDMFAPWQEPGIGHIQLADRAELVLVAPATANLIGKIASGLADDMLTTLIMATKAPVLLAPAMNVNMYENMIVQENLKKLLRRGYLLVEPAVGELACGWEGKGRLAEVEDIIEEAEHALSPKDFLGKRVMVTAGPTREPIDPVRYLTNYSSGKMGYAVARVARRRGADTVLISGPTALRPPTGVRFMPVASARDMFKAALKEAEWADIIVKASAVADYRPLNPVTSKLKKIKGQEKLTLELTENPDILFEIGRRKGERILVGFAAETSDLVKNARTKLKEKNLDLIVANDVTRPGAGFGTDTNIVLIVDQEGKAHRWPRMSKVEVAEKIFDRIQSLLDKKKKDVLKKR